MASVLRPLLLALFVLAPFVPAASAGCTLTMDDMGVCIAPAGGMPREVGVQTPLGGFQYTNPPCADCGAPQIVHLVLEGAGAHVNAVARCTDVAWLSVPPKLPGLPIPPDPPGLPDSSAADVPHCNGSQANINAPMTGLQVQHHSGKSCAKGHVPFLVVIQCTP